MKCHSKPEAIKYYLLGTKLRLVFLKGARNPFSFLKHPPPPTPQHTPPGPGSWCYTSFINSSADAWSSGPQPGPRSRLKGRQLREQGAKTAAGSAPTAAAGPVAEGRCRGGTSPPVPLHACAPTARASPGGTRSHPGGAPRHPPGGPLRQGASRGAPSGLGAPRKAAGMRGVASRDRGLGDQGCPRLVAAGRAHSGARSGSLPGGQRSAGGDRLGCAFPAGRQKGFYFAPG